MSVSAFRLSQNEAGSAAVKASVHAGCEQRSGVPVASPCAAYPSGSNREVHDVTASGSGCNNGMDSTIGQPVSRNDGALDG
jgi:hypothetical protein